MAEQDILRLLDAVQAELETKGLWQTLAPAPDKMMSTEPFSIDTLSFTEWLQWIYLARLRAMIDAGAQLPSGALVFPYAEEALKAENVDAPQLLTLIKELDKRLG